PHPTPVPYTTLFRSYNDAIKANGGWTLERIDPFTPCSSAANWTASTDASGGTPGAPNSVFAELTDTDPPALAQVHVIDEQTIELLFNEGMDQASLLAGDYAIVPAIGIADVEVAAPDRVRLTLAVPLTEGALHTITVSGVSDCPGNPIG